MKNILLVLIGLYYVVTLNARLIEKNTDRTLTTESKTTGSSPPIRLTRDIYEEDALTGFSKEDAVQSDEFVRSYNRRARHFFTSRTEAPPARVPRESHEKAEKEKVHRSNTTTYPPITPPKQNTLVKKPIPKYNEMDYEDDFQMKINRSPVKVVESGEHEDEDFNLDDYDFDVNHDEFVGRGKPLEPRTKQKDTRERLKPSIKPDTKPVLSPEIKIQSKVVAPVTIRSSNKRERAVELPKKISDDYYDDSTTTKAPEKETKPRDLEDEFNDENEESKEFDGKVSSVRMVRSPWKLNSYVDKLGEKTSSVMSKVLSILPMFPQVPNKNDDEYNMNDQPIDPWHARHLSE